MRRTFISTLAIAALALASAPFARATDAPVPDVEALGSSLNADAPALRAADGGLELIAAPGERGMFAIYSITGQLVKTVEVAAGSRETVALPGGCYVVRCSAWAKKIVVR